ncbi:hypothetical protein MuYL_1020 [Mucilaginibacter xinganensis]|uniref:Uncharacterized protein n=1 Tax=Mucilaginibacter xinganensis TaxID=1234841 RepID=A0A223NT32_9SPHI|nr:hypothetical protein MuYL_1020 [Mucilaginibacter xinganensis]
MEPILQTFGHKFICIFDIEILLNGGIFCYYENVILFYPFAK